MKNACPICKKLAPWKNNPNRPFCSERCRMTDLGAWASEKYRVQGENRPSESDTGESEDAPIHKTEEH